MKRFHVHVAVENLDQQPQTMNLQMCWPPRIRAIAASATSHIPPSP